MNFIFYFKFSESDIVQLVIFVLIVFQKKNLTASLEGQSKQMISSDN